MLIRLLQSCGLTPCELRTLARHLFDGESKAAIAREQHVSHTAIGQRIRSGLRKLARRKLVPVDRTRRHRRRPGCRTVEPMDPRLFDRMHKGRAGWHLRTWQPERNEVSP